jgi:multimeric flavodoxin WrbA
MSGIMSTRKILLLIGSPRKNSNTHLLAREAERALIERGVLTKTVFLNDLSFRDCQACHGCKQEGNETCIIRDDMQEIYSMMEEYAGIIVAAPVYFGSVPATAKAWLDRLVPFIDINLQPKLPAEKQVSFIFTQNMPDPASFRLALQGFIAGVSMTGMTVRDCLIATDLEWDMKPPVTERPELLEKAYAIGKDLAG